MDDVSSKYSPQPPAEAKGIVLLGNKQKQVATQLILPQISQGSV